MLKGPNACRPRGAAEPRGFVPKLWLLDLDDTILGSSSGMLRAIHLRMNDFISKRLGIDEAQAGRLRTLYWSRYGSTFLGLWRNHGIDPLEFLPATHDFDFSPYAVREHDAARVLRRLPGRRVLFTNGPRNYAESLVVLLNLRGVFDDIVSSTDMRLFGVWRPKPSKAMLKAVCAAEGVRPAEAVLVDDSPMNLRAGRAAGLRTVWCTGHRKRHGKLLWLRPLDCVDHAVHHFRELPGLFPGRRSKAC